MWITLAIVALICFTIVTGLGGYQEFLKEMSILKFKQKKELQELTTEDREIEIEAEFREQFEEYKKKVDVLTLKAGFKL